MGIDFNIFKDLPPERRARELQKLIDNLKKEIGERQDDIKKAEHFLALADEEARLLEQVAIPEAKTASRKKPEKIDALEEQLEERKLTREERTELEKLLATAPPRSPELLHRVAHMKAADLYNEGKIIYQQQKETGVETAQQREAIYAIRKGLEIKKEEGYNQNQNVMTAAEKMAETVYKGGAGTYKRTPG